MMRTMALVLVIALSGCGLAVGTKVRPSGDTKSWITHRVDIGDYVVQFTIPPGVSEVWLDPPVPLGVILGAPGVFDETGLGPELLSRHWDYQKNFYAHVDGTLTARIWLMSSEVKLIDLKSLESAIVETERRIHEKRSSDGGTRWPPVVPEVFEPRNIAGRQGLHVHYSISLPDYAVAIDEHHYLMFYARHSVSFPEWRKDANAAVDAIVKSIRIEPKR